MPTKILNIDTDTYSIEAIVRSMKYEGVSLIVMKGKQTYLITQK